MFGADNGEFLLLALTVGERAVRLLLVLFAGWAAYHLLRRVLPRVLRSGYRRLSRNTYGPAEQRLDTLTSVLVTTAEVVVLTSIALMALQELGFAVGPLIAGLGIVGIAVGFGTQSLVRDMISGLIILVEDQYRKGDIIQVGTLRGTVEDVNLRRTVLRDLDGTVHSISNGQVMVSSNFSKEWVRVNVDVPLRYGVDLGQARAVAEQVGREMAEGLSFRAELVEPPRWDAVTGLTENTMTVRVTAVVRPRAVISTTNELRYRLLNAYVAEGLLGSAEAAAEDGAAEAASRRQE